VEPRLDALSALLRRTRASLDQEPVPARATAPQDQQDPDDALAAARAELQQLRAQLDETRTEAERNAAESQIVRMITRGEAEGERERRVAAEQAAERAAAERGAAREALAEARARLEELERQEGQLAARVREERHQREDLQVRLAAIARATQQHGAGATAATAPARDHEVSDAERRLAEIRADLLREPV
jgi:colicin import membrane protein